MAARQQGERPRARTQPRGDGAQTQRRLPLPVLIVAAVALTALIVMLGRFCSAAATIDVTVNGNALSLHGEKTLDTAIRESGLPINPGDFLSLDGVVLKRGAGNAFYATVNGEETLDRDRALKNGDEIYLTDGKDVVEEYDATEETVPCGALVLGVGAICTFKEGTPKIIEHRVGRESGAQVDRVKQSEEKATAQWYQPDVGDDKVIALTFDCGPSTEYTAQILNVLAENEAKATFFCEGKNVEENPGLVERAQSEGHQIASNTYDCKIDENSQTEYVIDEVRRGFSALDKAIGTGAATAQESQSAQANPGWFGMQNNAEQQEEEKAPRKRIVRFPNALLTTAWSTALVDEVDAVIGWDLDTGDWSAYNSEGIYDVLLEAEPGDIVVMHDGDYDCSYTAPALRKALPELKKRGYSFITIDELMSYPAKQYE